MLSILIHLLAIGGANARPQSLDHLPVRRDEEIAEFDRAKHLRIRRHEEQLENYRRNMLDELQLATHDEIQLKARDLAVAAKKRAPTDAHSQPMQDFFNGANDILYTISTAVGTPGQVMDLVPDTGSADLWVPWVRSNIGTQNHYTFDPSQSSTFRNLNQTFVATYGLGRAEGQIISETVQMGGFTVAPSVLGLATEVDAQFQRQANDGIMGFSSSRLSKYPARTFFENLILNNALPDPYFSVFLTRGRDIQPGRPGWVQGSELCLGCMATPINQTYSGDMLYIPVTTFAWFQVEQESISVNGQVIPGTSCQAMFDTGTTLIYLPQNVADAALAPLGAQRTASGGYVVPRTSISDTTKIAFTYGGRAFDVNILDIDTTYSSYLLNIYASNVTGTQGEPLAIIGDAFLKNVISVYHYAYNGGGPAVGLRQLVSQSRISLGSTTAPVASSTNPGFTGQLGSITGTGSLSGGQVRTTSRIDTLNRDATGTASAGASSTSRAAAQKVIARGGAWVGTLVVSLLLGGFFVL